MLAQGLGLFEVVKMAGMEEVEHPNRHHALAAHVLASSLGPFTPSPLCRDEPELSAVNEGMPC